MSLKRQAGRALVLGAAGHIGNAVTRKLLEDGWTVTAAGRRIESPPNLDGLTVDYRSLDSSAPDQLSSWCEDRDLVVDAAAPYPVDLFFRGANDGGPPLEFARRRTQELLESVARHECGFAYVSSFTTQVRRQRGPTALQSSLLRRLHPYFQVKEWIESRVLEAAAGGLHAVVVNPTTCFGPWDSKPAETCLVPQLLRGGVGGVAEHVINVIDVRDVADGLVAAVEAERYGESLLLTGHSLQVSHLVAWLCEIGGVAPPRWSLPAELSVLPSIALEAVWAMIGRASPSPALVPGLLCEQSWMAPGRAQRELGLRPRSLHGTLVDSVAWYRGLGYC